MSNVALTKGPAASLTPDTDGLICGDLPFDTLQTIFDLGKQQTARHLYSLAIEFFTVAIKDVQCSILSILYAHRAEAYKGSGDYKKPVEDANRSIELSPELPAGYLTAAAVLQLQGNDGKALVTLSNLLSSVSTKHSLYHTFVARKQSLERQVEKTNGHVLQSFSYDILNRVFSHLSLKYCVNASLTCRSWRNFFDQWTPMYRKLDLTDALIPRIHLTKAAKLRQGLRILTLLDLHVKAADALDYLRSIGCSHIEHIGKPL